MPRPSLPRPTLIVAIAVIVVAAACGSSVSTPSTPADSPASALPTISTTDTPGVSDLPSPSVPAETASASAEASPSPTPSASATPGGPDAAAGACSGSSEIRDFFVAIAQAVPWPVYCAVLPAGWSVEGGTYRLAAGGRMDMSYKTASGGHLELREGHWCTDGASACSQHDTDLGVAPFGAESGELMTLAGGYVLYVDPGENPSWTATGSGVDEATFRQLCANLALVSV
jgi:hypothetical protein